MGVQLKNVKLCFLNFKINSTMSKKRACSITFYLCSPLKCTNCHLIHLI